VVGLGSKWEQTESAAAKCQQLVSASWAVPFSSPILRSFPPSSVDFHSMSDIVLHKAGSVTKWSFGGRTSTSSFKETTGLPAVTSYACLIFRTQPRRVGMPRFGSGSVQFRTELTFALKPVPVQFRFGSVRFEFRTSSEPVLISAPKLSRYAAQPHFTTLSSP